MEEERSLREKDGRAGTRRRGSVGLIKMVDGLRGAEGKSGKRGQKSKEAGITRESDAGKCDGSVFIKINTV